MLVKTLSVSSTDSNANLLQKHPQIEQKYCLNIYLSIPYPSQDDTQN